MIYLAKGTAKIVTNLADKATIVADLTDEDILANIEAVKDIKKNLQKNTLKWLEH